MPVQAKYDWKSESLTDSADGPAASREWYVDGTTNIVEALTAPPQSGDPPIAQINESHPNLASLRCRSRLASRNMQQAFKVVASYGIPPSGEWQVLTGDTGDLLSKKPSISWGKGKIPIQTDVDIYGLPLVNSAGDGIEKTRYLNVKYLTITRYERGYNYPVFRFFENTTNRTDIKVGGVTFRAGEVYCDGIEPAEAYAPDAPVIPISYAFQIIQEYRIVNGQYIRMERPWDVLNAYKDQGLSGWANTSSGLKKGDLFWADNGEKITVELAFDGLGHPINKNVKVGLNGSTGTMYTPVGPPKLPKLNIASYSNADVKIIEPRMIGESDFNGLQIFQVHG